MRAIGLWLALVPVAACHHGVDGDAATSWLQTRGRDASTWEPCLRIGTAMHAACGSDARCGLAATRTFTYWCYAGRYGGRHPTTDPLALSPCFWSAVNRHGDRATDPGEPGYITLDVWAAQICGRLALPATACSAELHDVAQSCTEDLTGAGP